MRFALPDFLPYRLNRAAEDASHAFEARYRALYGMRRTEWRVLFHLGCHGAMTARAICDRASLHKTKVSRAVAALERKRFVARAPDVADRRRETLSLTRAGRAAFETLAREAEGYEAALTRGLSAAEVVRLRDLLGRLTPGPP